MVFRASLIFYFWRLFEISEGAPLEKTTEPWSPTTFHNDPIKTAAKGCSKALVGRRLRGHARLHFEKEKDG